VKGRAIKHTIVDIHPHVITDDDTRYPKRPLGGKQSTWSQERPAPVERLIAEMDAAGVDKAAIVQSSTSYGHDNSYLADAVDAHRDRCTGVVSVDACAPDSIERLSHWIDARRMAGLRLFTTGSTMPGQADWLDSAATYPVWEWAGERAVPICVQMRLEAIDRLRSMMDRFPATPVILDHLAFVDSEDGPPYTRATPLFELASYQQLHLKITTNSLWEMEKGAGSPQSFLPQLVHRFGAHRMAWGSNFPASAGSMTELVKLASTAFETAMSSEDVGRVMGGTALRLYPVLGRELAR